MKIITGIHQTNYIVSRILIVCFCYLFNILQSFAQPPSNDDYAGATDLSPTAFGYDYVNYERTADVAFADMQPGESPVGDGTYTKTVWYKFTIPSTRRVTIKLGESNPSADDHSYFNNPPNPTLASIYFDSFLPAIGSATTPTARATFPFLNGGNVSTESCLPKGTYYFRISATAATMTPIKFKFITESSISITQINNWKVSDVPSTVPVQVINAGSSGYVSFTTGCFSKDDINEVLPALGVDFDQTVFASFKINRYSDKGRLSLSNLSYDSPAYTTYLYQSVVGYNLYNWNPATSAIPPPPIKTGILNYSNPNIDFACSFLQGDYVTIQLFYHKSANVSGNYLSLNLLGNGTTTGVSPLAPNIIPVSISPPNIQGGTLSQFPNKVACNSYMNVNKTGCSNEYIFPTSGYLLKPLNPASPTVIDTLQLAQFYKFTLTANANLRIENSGQGSVRYMRLFNGDIGALCNTATEPQLVKEWGSDAWYTMVQKCLPIGTYSLQILGYANQNKVYSDPKSGLGYDNTINIYAQEQSLAVQAYGLITSESYNKVNHDGTDWTRLVDGALLSSGTDVIGCASTPLTIGGNTVCGVGVHAAMYRTIRVDRPGNIFISNLHKGGYPYLKYRFYRGLPVASGNVVNFENDLTSGNCLEYYDQSFCVTPGDYTLVTFGTPDQIGFIDAPQFRFYEGNAQPHNSPITAEDLGTISGIINSNIVGANIVRAENVRLTCDSQVYTIDGIATNDRGLQYEDLKFDKVIFRQFYLDSPAKIEIAFGALVRTVPGGFIPVDDIYSRFKIYRGKVTEVGVEGLRRIPFSYSKNYWKLDLDTYSSYFENSWVSADCQPLEKGWYTVVQLWTGGSYDGMNGLGIPNLRDYYKRSSAGYTAGLEIKKAASTSGTTKYNRPWNAYFAGNLAWERDYSTTNMYPYTKVSTTLGADMFTCDPDNLDPSVLEYQTFPLLPADINGGVAGRRFDRVAYYVFNLTKESYAQIAIGGGPYSKLYSELYALDVRTDYMKLNQTLPGAAIPFKPLATSFDIMRMQPGIYTLVIYGRTEDNGIYYGPMAPTITLESTQPTQYDFAKNTYDFGALPTDGTEVFQAVKDNTIDNPIYPGRYHATDFISSLSSGSSANPQWQDVETEFCPGLVNGGDVNHYPTAKNKNHVTGARKNLWYTFQIDGPGVVKVSVHNRTKGQGQGVVGYDPTDRTVPYGSTGRQFPYQVFYMNDPAIGTYVGVNANGTYVGINAYGTNGGLNFKELVSRKLLDSTYSGLKRIAHNLQFGDWNPCMPPLESVSFSLDPCEADIKRRYFIVVENNMTENIAPNNQVDVSVSFNKNLISHTINDYYAQALPIVDPTLPPSKNKVLKAGKYFGDNSTYQCATRTSNEQTKCGQKTIWYKFTSQIAGTLRVKYITNDESNFKQSTNASYVDNPDSIRKYRNPWNWNNSMSNYKREIAVYRELIPGDSTSNGLEFLGLGYDGVEWYNTCLTPGNYYVVLTGCSNTPYPVKPQIWLEEAQGDLCSNAYDFNLYAVPANNGNTPVVSSQGFPIGCQSWGGDFGEDGFTNVGSCIFESTSLAGDGFPLSMKDRLKVKSSWVRLNTNSMIGNVSLKFKASYTNTPGDAEIFSKMKYNVFIGNCDKMERQSCVGNSTAEFEISCVAPNTSLLVQIISPKSYTGQNFTLYVEAKNSTCPNPVAPVNTVKYTKVNACVNNEVCFENKSLSSYLGRLDYLWDFGDGTSFDTRSMTGANLNTKGIKVCHTYTSMPANGNYMVSLTMYNTLLGISETYRDAVVVAPEMVVNAGKDITICNGQAATLSGTGGVNYAWSPVKYISNANMANPKVYPPYVRPTVAGNNYELLLELEEKPYVTNYILKAYNAFECMDTDTVAVSVTKDGCSAPIQKSITPDFGISVSGICSGTEVCFQNKTSSVGVDDLSYTWVMSTIAGATLTGTNTCFTFDKGGKVNVTLIAYSPSANLTQSITKIFEVLETTKANAGVDQKVCKGQSVQLLGSGGEKLIWRNALGEIIDTVRANPWVTPLQTTTYRLTAMYTTKMCPSTDDVVVTVYEKLTVDLGPDKSICPGKSVTLDAGNPSAYYLWSTGDTTQAVSVNKIGTYSVSVSLLPIPKVPMVIGEPQYTKSTKNGLTYLGSYNSNGKPNYLTQSDVLSSDYINMLGNLLPEQKSVPSYNPDYLNNVNVELKIVQTSDVYVTFLKEGASYKNALGFYTYPLSSPPTKSSQIAKHYIVFPNASDDEGTDVVHPGNKVKIGTFPRNTGIGWFIIPDGYNGVDVSNYAGQTFYYSNAVLNNSESNVDKKQHVIAIKEELISGGIPFGLSPAWAKGREFTKVFDGKKDTYFDYSKANGGMVGLDLKSVRTINKIVFIPRQGYENRMIRGKFQGSNTSSSTGFVDIHTISIRPTFTKNVVVLPSNVNYRYIRYVSPDGGYGNIAEMELYSPIKNTIIGFEDLNRSWSGGDDDFNDLVFSASTKVVDDANSCIESKEINVNKKTNCGCSCNGRLEASVYPNPNEGTFNVMIENDSTELVDTNEIEIHVYNALGTEVLHKQYTSTMKLFPIDLINQPAGIYTVKLLVGDKQFTQKIFINK